MKFNVWPLSREWLTCFSDCGRCHLIKDWWMTAQVKGIRNVLEGKLYKIIFKCCGNVKQLEFIKYFCMIN